MSDKKKIFHEKFEALYFFHGNSHNWGMQDFHIHDQHEILLFLNSGSTLEVGDRRYVAAAGDMFLVSRKEHHRTKGAAGQSYERYVLQFDPALLEGMAEAFGYNFVMAFEDRPTNFMHKIHLPEGNLILMKKLFAKVEENIISGTKGGKFSVKLKLSILELLVTINEMWEFFSKDQNHGSIHTENVSDEGTFEVEAGISKDLILQRDRIEAIKKYIKDHCEEKLMLDNIAQRFYVSTYYLSHYFKKETGFTLVQYITNQKLNESKKLLRAGFSVTEVAMRLSFSSDSHFITVFKKNCGITPKQFVKRMDNIEE